jgi:hypothetical protein
MRKDRSQETEETEEGTRKKPKSTFKRSTTDDNKFSKTILANKAAYLKTTQL